MRRNRSAYAVPHDRVARGKILPPPSKSLTQRVLNLALLARRPVTAVRPLISEDTELFLAALRSLGVDHARDGTSIRLIPTARPERAKLWCGDNGTMLRFLTASLAVTEGDWALDGSARLRQRPVGPLVDALRALGARIEYLGETGFAPLQILGGRFAGPATVELDASRSSQFVSALLMAATQLDGPLEVEVGSTVSAPYLDLTLEVLRYFGADVNRGASSHRFVIRPVELQGREYTVEADLSAAAYPAAAAVLTRGEVEVMGVGEHSQQGDRRFLDVLVQMGASIEWGREGVRVRGSETLKGVDVDLVDVPDQVPTLAALAPFAHGRTVIRNVGHLRLKESDRLSAMATELSRLGAVVVEQPDGLTIEGTWSTGTTPAERVVVDSHGDHRVAMSLAVCGLRRPGVVVDNPSVVAKSYPSFWSDFESLLGA